MFRAYLFLLLFIPLSAIISLSALLCTLVDSSGRLYHLHAVAWARTGLWLAGVRVEVEGREKVPQDEPVIFMCNHQSNFDILSLYMAIPQKFAWVAKEELFRIPIFGHSMARAGYVPLDRSDGRKSLKSMETAAERIRNGKSVVIFPEGTRTLDGNLLPFKQGGFLLAGKASVPVVPVAISGSMRINPPRRRELYPGTIRVVFADAVAVTGPAPKQREALMDKVKTAIVAGLETATT